MFAIFAALFLFQAQASLVEGTVVKADSGGPLSKALVELRSIDGNAASADVAVTTADGKFVFRQVQPGRYKLSVTRAGYVSKEFKPEITVAAGGASPAVRFELVPTASIYGRVTDPNGQPLANASVRATRTSYASGEVAMKTEQTAITNDLGEYRLFWLPPGTYFVSALPYSPQHGFGEMLTSGTNPQNDPGVGIGSRSVPGMEDFSVTVLSAILNQSFGSRRTEQVYLPTYFPGTNVQDHATPIKVRPADNIGRIDLTVAPIETHHIRGIIMNSVTGQPDPRAQLRRARTTATSLCATPRMNSVDCSFAVVDYDNATFDIPFVTPGRYTLYGMDNDLVGQAFVEVQDSDVDNVVITLRPGLSLTGQFTPPVAQAEVRLSPGPPVPGRTPADSSAQDGSFSIRGLTPGDYSVTISGLNGYYVKSVTAADTDVLTHGIRVAETGGSPMQIVVADNGGTVEGHVVNSRGESAGSVTVALIPDENQQHRSDLYRVAQTDVSGRYQLRDIAPGNYKLFAWDDVEPDAWRNSEFLRAYEDNGRAVAVPEGSHQQVDTTVIPSQVF